MIATPAMYGREVKRVRQPQARGARPEQDDRDDALDQDDRGTGRVVDAVLRPEQVETDELTGRARRDVVDGVGEGGHRDQRQDRHGTPGAGQQVRRAGGPGDHDDEVQEHGGRDRSRVGVAQPVAELPRLRAPRDERQQRDGERAPHERMAQEAPHRSVAARRSHRWSSPSQTSRREGWDPAPSPSTDWTVIGVDRLQAQELAAGQGRLTPSSPL